METLNKDYEAVQSKYDELARIVKRFRSKFEEFKKHRSREAVELPKVVVRAPKELEGHVLVVNDVFRFVVVDLGRNDGLQEGMYLDVIQGGEKPARLQVDRLYDSLAACSVITPPDHVPVQVQDMVKTV